MESISVVKVSGNELDSPVFLAELARVLANFANPRVLVHGGGKEITAALERYGHTSEYVDGLRITPPAMMDIMEMVVCGSISKRIVARLAQAGQPALGMSGADLGILRCRPYVAPSGTDLGRVGAITAVDVAALLKIIDLQWLPVFAPVALGADDGLAYNVNADHVAQAIAIALSEGERRAAPAELLFVSNVPGVILDGQVQPQLSAATIERAIGSGAIRDGMVPKVRSALAALDAGVASVRICDLPGFATGGTRIVA